MYETLGPQLEEPGVAGVTQVELAAPRGSPGVDMTAHTRTSSRNSDVEQKRILDVLSPTRLLRSLRMLASKTSRASLI